MADKPQYAYSGLIEVVDNSAMARNSNQNRSVGNYETTNKVTNYDKQSGAYMRGTAKESYSSGDYSNRGKVGYKDEYKSSSTVRVGDQGGYTEYHQQEKVTRVNYDTGSNYSGGSKGGNNYGSGSSQGGYYGGGSKGYKSYGGGKKYLD